MLAINQSNILCHRINLEHINFIMPQTPLKLYDMSNTCANQCVGRHTQGMNVNVEHSVLANRADLVILADYSIFILSLILQKVWQHQC